MARPWLPSDLVERHHLLQHLDRGLTARLILLVAPAGSGKSTLLSAWSAGHTDVAWLSLEPRHDDLVLFAGLLIRAIRRAIPRLETEIPGLLHLAELPSPRRLARQLATELHAQADELTIVLDDFQSITSSDVSDFVVALASFVPAHVHLVVSSRIDPAFPIDRLRARGELVEVRWPQLRFTLEEQRQFLKMGLGTPPNDDLVSMIDRRFEGWAAGLRLAILALGPRSGTKTIDIERLGADVSLAREFLIRDVLAVLPPEVQQIALRAAIPDEICAPLLGVLCDVDLTEPGEADRLATLLRHNVFLTALDEDGTWFRFHPLFREAVLQKLRAERRAEEIAALHARASSWLAPRGLTAAAIRHALAAGDSDRAVMLVEAHVHASMDQGVGPEPIDRWLRQLPAELIDDSPGLLLARAWKLVLSDRPRDVPDLLRATRLLLDRHGRRLPANRQAILRGQAATLESTVLFNRGDPRGAADAADRALALLPPDWSYVRGRAALYRSTALQALGRADEATDWLAAVLETLPHTASMQHVLISVGLARLHFVHLDLKKSDLAARDLLRFGVDRQIALATGWGRLFLGLIAYERNDLDAAQLHFQSLGGSIKELPMPPRLDVTLGFAAAYLAKGEVGRARATVRDLAALLREIGDEGALELVASFESRLDLASLRLNSSEISRRLPTGERPPPYRSLVEDPRTTAVRLLLRWGTPAAVSEAARLVDVVERWAAATHHPLRQARAALLRVLVLDAAGECSAALDLLGQVVARTRAGGHVRTYVDLGEPLRRLLAGLAGPGAAPDLYIDRLLAAFDHPETADSVAAPRQAGPADSPSPRAEVEPLTWRELEILELLAQRLSNKEIATQLVISPLTVKRHSMNIYQKLHVAGRRDAVERAASLGLLPTG